MHEAEDERFMRMAIEQAKLGERSAGGAEVGCVIVKDGVVLMQAYNEAELRKDPTAHAEMVAIRRLGAASGNPDFTGCTLYCTLQPCGMCTLACIWAHVKRIVYGATRQDVHPMYFAERSLDTVDYIRDTYRNDVEVVGGVLAEECSKLYYRPEDQPEPEEMRHQQP
jgi:tRNA(adenine34) deaminase